MTSVAKAGAADSAHAKAIADAAIRACVRVAVAESLTSGAFASALGAAPDAADWFAGAVVAYSAQVKVDVLGVVPGPVITAECARQMAVGAAKLLGAHLVAAVTGVGGPGSQEGYPAGTVFLAHGVPDSLRVEELHLHGSPDDIVRATVDAALAVLAADLEGARA